MIDIPINLAVEDDLSEVVLKEILKQSQRPFSVGMCLKRQGYGYLKKNISGINHAAKGSPYLVLTDLDKNSCPLALIEEWLSQPKHPNLIFRVAVIEVEAWLLAHREAFAQFLGIPANLIPYDLDNEPLFLTFTEPEHSLQERRFIIMGESAQGRLLVVARTDCTETTRLISALLATFKERKAYESDL